MFFIFPRKKTAKENSGMSSRTLWFKLLLALIQAGLILNPHNVKANSSDSFNCVNSTLSTSCIYTYEQLYNSLAKSDNSFNIESALYPAMRPSSVLVRVSMNYGPKCNAKYYLWSISCLYAAVPAILLEVSSLGSILVTPRTQDLTIRIPLFCCNVSDKESERQPIIKGMIKGVLAAVSAPEFNCITHNYSVCSVHDPSTCARFIVFKLRCPVQQALTKMTRVLHKNPYCSAQSFTRAGFSNPIRFDQSKETRIFTSHRELLKDMHE